MKTEDVVFLLRRAARQRTSLYFARNWEKTSSMLCASTVPKSWFAQVNLDIWSAESVCSMITTSVMPLSTVPATRVMCVLPAPGRATTRTCLDLDGSPRWQRTSAWTGRSDGTDQTAPDAALQLMRRSAGSDIAAGARGGDAAAGWAIARPSDDMVAPRGGRRRWRGRRRRIGRIGGRGRGNLKRQKTERWLSAS